MRDLEIRGAGNVLGVEQSGHMLSVGYELYCKLVDEAVRELKAEREGIELEPELETDTEVNLNVSAYIPEEYITDEMLRLDMYKRIASVSSLDEQIEVSDELLDRFGEIPEEVGNLLDIALLHNRASKLGVSKIVLQRDELIFIFENERALTPEAIEKLLDAYDLRLTIFGGVQPKFSLVLKSAPATAEALNVFELMS